MVYLPVSGLKGGKTVGPGAKNLGDVKEFYGIYYLRRAHTVPHDAEFNLCN